MQNPIHSIKQYYGETVEEVKKCTWPKRDALFESTFIVIVAVVLLGLYVFLIDNFFQRVFHWILTMAAGTRS